MQHNRIRGGLGKVKPGLSRSFWEGALNIALFYLSILIVLLIAVALKTRS